MKKLFVSLVSVVTLAMVACAPNKEQLTKALSENPEILTEAIKKNPKKIMDALNDAARDARKSQAENEEKEREKALEDEFKNPKKPEISDNRAILGSDSAPVTIVEYSDFECPYCTRGYNVIKQVKETYGDKVRFMYKHLPLDFHPLAMPAAKYFEAIALQDEKKAYKFHDEIFENQGKLKSDREKFLAAVAKKLGIDMGKLKTDLDSEEVKKRIEADKAEANKFGFFGTPGFLINGVSIKGAYPFPEFKKIIDRHLAN